MRSSKWGGDGLVPAFCQLHGVLRERAVPYVFSAPTRGAGFIPQEREDRTDAPAKFQSLLRSPTPLRTEVRAIVARAAPALNTYAVPAPARSLS